MQFEDRFGIRSLWIFERTNSHMDPVCMSSCCSGLSADGAEAGFVTDDDDEHDTDDNDDGER